MKHIDNELIQRVISGDIAAFEEIYKRTCDYVFSVSYRIAGNKEAAEEIVQDVFLQVYEKVGTFHFRSSFTTWLYRISVNKTLNYIKKNKRHYEKRELFDTVKQVHPATADRFRPLEQKENEAYIQSMLRILNNDQRACIVLRDIEGLKYDDIACVLGISVNTVKTRIKRAREKLIRIFRKR